MLTANLNNVQTLEQFYKQIRTQQEGYHGLGYCGHHDAIADRVRGKRYKELGTHQGATGAAAILAGAVSAELVDISHVKIRPFQHLFEQYCQDHNIELSIVESNSIDPRVATSADILLIDSKHTYDHCSRELKLHGPTITEYIVLHDTTHPSSGPGLIRAVNEYCSQSNWKILETNTNNVGYTVLGKK